MPTIFLNGVFVSPDQAKVSAFDAGFQHGVGLFETMQAIRTKQSAIGSGGSRVLFLDEHMARLANSAKSLGLTERLRIDPLAEAVRRATRQAFEDHPDATHIRLRLTLTGGDLNLLDRARTAAAQAGGEVEVEIPEQTPTMLIVGQRATKYPEEMFQRGVLATIADLKLNPLDPFAGHKTLNYWARLRELQVAASKRAAEALVFQITNHLAGGCVSNVLLVKDDVVLTPIAQGEEAEVAHGGDGAAAFGTSRDRDEMKDARRELADGLNNGLNDEMEDGSDDEMEDGFDDEDDLPQRGNESVNGRASNRTSGTLEEGAQQSGGGGVGAIMPSPVLPGIVRRWALDVALSEAMATQRRMLTIEDVLEADEVILTNSSWGALPVTRLEGRPIGTGSVGAFAKRLREAWVELTTG